MLPAGEERERGKSEQPGVRAILTDRDTGDVRFERLIAQMENMRGENRDLIREVERVRRDMERLEVGELGPRLNNELDEINEKILLLETAQVEASETSSRRGGGDSESIIVLGENGEEIARTPEGDSNIPVMAEPGTGPAQPQVEKTIWSEMPEVVEPAQEAARGGRGQEDATPAQQSTIRVIEAEKKEGLDGEGKDEEDEGVYLPSGSILTGTLVTGMDAPTGQGARQEPFPALLRLKHEAILPNRYRADVRECFVIVGGFGDLSSERAYLRGESISCIRNDGKVVESSLESYTVGEDGKAGLRGRLVSKQGQMLAKAMMAGVMEGFAGAFNRTPVPTLSLEAGERQLYQQAFSGDAVQSGAVSGVGKALDRLAQFYIDQADGMFPVIEIDAGREVEIIMIRGGKLALR
ncbi:MAG: conjugal transfer protein TraB [Halomonadaceae bacterium]|nr:conjugal transfer protein TraB [Halomonadaceae bacterium]